MSGAMTPAANGRARRSLNDTIARLDDMIDGLSAAIPDTIRDTLKESLGTALGEAIAEGVKAAVVEVLSNPALLAAVRGPNQQPKSVTLRERMRRAVGRTCQAATGWLRSIVRKLANVRQVLSRRTADCRMVLGHARQYRRPLIVSALVGLTVCGVAGLAPGWVGAVLSGIGGALTAAAVQAGLWFRRALQAVIAG